MLKKNTAVKYRVFKGSGGNSEYFISVEPAPAGGFAEQSRAAAEGYARALRGLGLAPGSAVFRRVFLAAAPGRSPLPEVPGEGPVAVSLVRQPPLPGRKIALLAYHLQGGRPLVKRRLAPGHLAVGGGGLRHIWSAGLSGRAVGPAGEQTRLLFGNLSRALRLAGGSLRGSCVRTWLFLGDIGRSYGDMVTARSEVFRRHGLTQKTHYIASTGIEGSLAGRPGPLGMDAYSVAGLKRGQVSYLNDFSRLCRTADYDVTFERGTRVAYADRAHYFISGTASIDKAGNILHPGDAVRQLGRAIGNIAALLRSGGAGLSDLMYLIVYLRDSADFPGVNRCLEKNFPGLPLVVVRGAVCRPGWLVEVEGVAAVKLSAPELPRF